LLATAQIFICYLAVNFGAHFKEENVTDKEPTFIANVDSSSVGEGMNPFVQWLLAVIYKLPRGMGHTVLEHATHGYD
jgi:hypothetical protein